MREYPETLENTPEMQAAWNVLELMPLIQNKWMRKFTPDPEEALTPLQISALSMLENVGAMPMNEAASGLHMSKQQLTRFADTLVKRGLAQRSHRGSNRRTIYISITDEGRDLMRRNSEVVCRFHAGDIRKLYTVEEMEQMIEAAKTLCALLERI
jgi:DNA-binding MarR family transcriptional regulator